MEKILVVADPLGGRQRVLGRAADLARSLGASLDVVGFVYEHVANLPLEVAERAAAELRERLLDRHRGDILARLESVAQGVPTTVEVHWEKRVADWVAERAETGAYDMVVKGGHRSETFLYTSTDWQLLRSCRVPVLLLADKKWRRGRDVMAAVDLGTRVRSKQALNYEIATAAAALAKALQCGLHVSYAIPFSKVLRDLDLLDEAKLRREGRRLAESFCKTLADRGIDVDGIHVATGAPASVLVSQAAKNGIGTVVLGCVGRKRLAGRVLGNTAEQVLSLMKADVLAVKP